jgi:hypothetical protein
MCVCVHMYVCRQTCALCVCTHMHVFGQMCVYVCVCVYIYIYIYIYICLCAHKIQHACKGRSSSSYSLTRLLTPYYYHIFEHTLHTNILAPTDPPHHTLNKHRYNTHRYIQEGYTHSPHMSISYIFLTNGAIGGSLCVCTLMHVFLLAPTDPPHHTLSSANECL